MSILRVIVIALGIDALYLPAAFVVHRFNADPRTAFHPA